MPDVNPYAPPREESIDPERTVFVDFLMDEALFLESIVFDTDQEGAGRLPTVLLGLGSLAASIVAGGPLVMLFDWNPGPGRNFLIPALAIGAVLVLAAFGPWLLRYYFFVIPWSKREVERLQQVHSWLRWGEWRLEVTARELILRTPTGGTVWQAKRVKLIESKTNIARLSGGIFLKTADFLLTIPRGAACSERPEVLLQLLRRRCLTPAFIGWK